MPTDQLTLALAASVRVASVGLGITALELVVDRRAFAAGGPFAADVHASLKGRRPPWWLGEAKAVGVVAAVQVAACAVLLVAGPLSAAGRLALVTALASALALRWRRSLVGDGAEQLTVLVLVAAALALVPAADPTRSALAVLFVSAQACLAYLTAGIAKLISPVWRHGNAVGEILATATHGHAPAARLLATRPALGRALGWAVMAFEISFPFLLLGPWWLALTALAAGLAFHLGCAWLMGLNSFLWAFPATYPCLLGARAVLLG